MGQPYVGEIRMFAGNFPPNGWMFCDGATLAIAENDVLFQLIGTTYGGDGQETFNLLANSQGPQPYIQEDPDGSLNQQALTPSGGSQPHENLQPFLGINFIISLFGIFPPQS